MLSSVPTFGHSFNWGDVDQQLLSIVPHACGDLALQTAEMLLKCVSEA